MVQELTEEGQRQRREKARRLVEKIRGRVAPVLDGRPVEPLDELERIELDEIEELDQEELGEIEAFELEEERERATQRLLDQRPGRLAERFLQPQEIPAPLPPEAFEEPVAPDIDIMEEAERRGLSVTQFVGPDQLADLALPPEERRVQWARYEQFLTAEQARWLGFDVPDGSLIRMTPMADGQAQFSLVPDDEPQAPSLETDKELEDALRDIYPEMFDPARSWGFSIEELPAMAIDSLYRQMANDYGGFIADLNDRVGAAGTEFLLRKLGVTEENILMTLDHTEQEARVTEAIQNIFPDIKSIEGFEQLLESDFNLFIETIQTGNSRVEKRRLLEIIGYNPWEINQLLSRQRLTVDIDGISQSVTVDIETQSAFDDRGNFVGRYNAVTREFTRDPEQNILKDFFDWTAFQSRTLWEAGENAFLSIMPEIIFRDMTDLERAIQGDAWADETDRRNRQLRENFRYVYGLNKVEYDEWVRKNPELVPTVEFQEGAFQHPELLTDPRYYAYELANIVPFIVTATAVTIATGGVGLPAVIGTAALMAPIEAQGVYEDLVNAGAPEGKAAPMAAIAGGFIGLLESAGRIPLLKQVSPFIFGQFKKKALTELAKRGLFESIKKFGRAFTINEFSEITTEVAQEVISNAAVSVYDENRGILDNLPDIAVKTAVANLLPAGGGGIASVRMVGRREQRGLTDIAKKAKGWLRDEKGNWFEQVVRVIREGEEGFTLLPGKGEQALPESVVPTEYEPLKAISDRNNRRGYNPDVITDEAIKTLKKQGLITGVKNIKLTREGLSKLTDWNRLVEQQRLAEGTAADLAQEAITEELARPEPFTPEAGIQPSLIEGVQAKEVRPKGKAEIVQISMDDQLKLDQARKAAEEAPDEARQAFEAQEEITGLEVTLETDPVAQFRFKMGNRNVGLDSLISIREQTFPDTFTVKQAQAVNPHLSYERYTQPGTPQFNKVPRDAVLDQITQELGFDFTGGIDALANRIMAIRQEKRRITDRKADIKRQATETPLVGKAELTTAEVTENWETIGRPKLTLKQSDALVGFFADYLNDPNAATAWELTRELRRETLAERSQSLKVRTQELIVTEGMGNEEAINQAIRETLAGELPSITTGYLEGLSWEIRDAMFAKVIHVLKNEPLEMVATRTALTNALAGKPIPRDPGKTGRSAYTRLQRVFGTQPKVLKAIDKMAKEKQPLEKVVEGIFHETGREPIPVDQETADYLRNLAIRPLKQDELGQPASDIVEALRSNEPSKLGEVPSLLTELGPLPADTRAAHEKSIDLQNFKLEIRESSWGQWTAEELERVSYIRSLAARPEALLTLIDPLALEPGVTPIRDIGPSDLRVTDLRNPRNLAWAKMEQELGSLFADGTLTFDEYQLERAQARDTIFPLPPITKYEGPIEDAFKEIPLWPVPVRDNVIKVLKELAWSPVDIGNFLRANKASFDFSFWRQQSPLIVRHPVSFAQANVEAWKAIWSQKSAEASWQKITRDPLYQIYEFAAEEGGDFLRPLILPKGTSQWRGTEEFGYITGERVIPRLTGKIPHVRISARAFETGTNEHNWLIFKNYYRGMLALSEQYATGQKKLKAGEVFNIQKEMTDFSKSLANFTARGSLGKQATSAAFWSGLFFAPRASIGRILSVVDLVNANPRVRRQAWENAVTFVGTLGGVILLGAAADWWDVEDDPRSAEYMSIRIGNTRIDPWGGFRQFLVFFTRMITTVFTDKPGGISSVTGAAYDPEALGLIQNLLVGKASPLTSTMLDFARGRNFVGEKVDVHNLRQWIERIAPFSVWDIWEAFEDNPRTAAVIALPAIVGAGVQTYTGDWKENWPKLGLPKYSDNTIYGLAEPYYDTADFWSDTASQFDTDTLAEQTAAKGIPEYIRAIITAKITKEHLDTLPTDRLVGLNADPAKGATFSDMSRIWRDRVALVNAGDEAELKLRELQPDGKYKVVTYKGDDAVKAFDQDERTRNAHQGNFSQRQFALLNEYWAITDKRKQAEFLEEHKADIGVKPRDEYLRTHTSENAQLAVWGQAKILTKEAYTEFKSLIKSLDIPDNAIPELTLPPVTSIDTHFEYEEMVSAGTHTSVEADLLLLKDQIAAEEAEVQSYTEWRTVSGESLTVSDKPVEYLQLRVDNQKLFDDLKDAMALPTKAERDAAVATVRDTVVGKETFRDIERRVEAMNKGTREAPIPDDMVNAYVDHMRIVDETTGNSAEAKLNRYDTPGLDEFLQDEDVWGKAKATALDEDKDYLDNYLVPRWRIEVEYREEDGEFNAFAEDDRVGRDAYLAGEGLEGADLQRRIDYRLDRRRHEALSMSDQATGDRFPTDQVENYVNYREIEVRGKRQERFLVNNGGQDPENLTGFAKAMHNMAGIDIPKAEDVPSVEYDNITDEWREDFTRLEGLSDRDSDFYVEDPDLRQQERDRMMFTTATRTYATVEGLGRAGIRVDNKQLTAFGLAWYERQAYETFVPDEFVNDYVAWKKIQSEGKPPDWQREAGTTLWFEDDWFMMEHLEFYRNIYRDLQGNQKWDFTKVPSREVFDKYLDYVALPSTSSRRDFRRLNRDLDDWGIIAFDWKPIEGELEEEELTARQKALTELRETRAEIRAGR